VDKKHCVNNRCIIRLGIFLNDPNTGRFPIEIIYLRNNRRGYVRPDQMKIRTLIDKGIIDRGALESEDI